MNAKWNGFNPLNNLTLTLFAALKVKWMLDFRAGQIFHPTYSQWALKFHLLSFVWLIPNFMNGYIWSNTRIWGAYTSKYVVQTYFFVETWGWTLNIDEHIASLIVEINWIGAMKPWDHETLGPWDFKSLRYWDHYHQNTTTTTIPTAPPPPQTSPPQPPQSSPKTLKPWDFGTLRPWHIKTLTP